MATLVKIKADRNVGGFRLWRANLVDLNAGAVCIADGVEGVAVRETGGVEVGEALPLPLLPVLLAVQYSCSYSCTSGTVYTLDGQMTI